LGKNHNSNKPVTTISLFIQLDKLIPFDNVYNLASQSCLYAGILVLIYKPVSEISKVLGLVTVLVLKDTAVHA